jgi:hypothetical protein
MERAVRRGGASGQVGFGGLLRHTGAGFADGHGRRSRRLMLRRSGTPTAEAAPRVRRSARSGAAGSGGPVAELRATS